VAEEKTTEAAAVEAGDLTAALGRKLLRQTRGG